MNLPAVEIVPLRGEMIWIPVDESLNIYESRGCSLRTQRNIVTSRGGSAIVRGLPIMINLRMNLAITGRVSRACARSRIIRNDCRVVDVESGIAVRRAHRSPTVNGVVCTRTVLVGNTFSLDSIDLNEHRHRPVIISNSARWPRGNPARRGTSGGKPALRNSYRRSDSRAEDAARLRG